MMGPLRQLLFAAAVTGALGVHAQVDSEPTASNATPPPVAAPPVTAPPTPPLPTSDTPRVPDSTLIPFADELSSNHGFERDALLKVLREAQIRDDIIAAMDRPAEAKPWHEYRLIFLTEDRIRDGAAFLRKHDKLLRKAEKTFGVPRQIIAAIIGVETKYGQRTGNFRVLDALFTLAFVYPKRNEFFRKELEEFLVLAREEKRDPTTLLGSYAGAMGHPQFMPSSFRRYAVDFDSDTKRDIWENVADVIGSVANYFKVHGWEKGQPVVTPARLAGPAYEPVLAAGIKPHLQVRDLPKNDIRLPRKQKGELLTALFDLDQPKGKEYWVAFNNFYVITRYNRSNLYAMAVYQLSEEILKYKPKPAKPKPKTKSKPTGNTAKPAPKLPAATPPKTSPSG